MMESDEKIIEELVDIDQLCKILKFKKSYVYFLTHQRKIPHYKVCGHLRFKMSDIEKWLSNHFIDFEESVKTIDF